MPGINSSKSKSLSESCENHCLLLPRPHLHSLYKSLNFGEAGSLKRLSDNFSQGAIRVDQALDAKILEVIARSHRSLWCALSLESLVAMSSGGTHPGSLDSFLTAYESFQSYPPDDRRLLVIRKEFDIGFQPYAGVNLTKTE